MHSTSQMTYLSLRFHLIKSGDRDTTTAAKIRLLTTPASLDRTLNLAQQILAQLRFVLDFGLDSSLIGLAEGGLASWA